MNVRLTTPGSLFYPAECDYIGGVVEGDRDRIVASVLACALRVRPTLTINPTTPPWLIAAVCDTGVVKRVLAFVVPTHAQSKHLERMALTHLAMSGCYKLKFAWRILKSTALVELNVVGGARVEKLCRPLSLHGQSLTALELRASQIGDDGARAIARLLPSLPALQKLSLSCNEIGGAGVDALCLAIRTGACKLHELDIQRQNPSLWRNARRTALGLITCMCADEVAAHQGGSIWPEDYEELWDALYRRDVVRSVLAMLLAPLASPVGRFMKRDGDNAIMTRVVLFCS